MDEPITFLLDADVGLYLADEIFRLEPAVDIWVMGREPAPPRTTLDPEILLFAEQHKRTVISMDKRTMPVHLHEHFSAGHHTWGVFMLVPDFPAIRYAEDLVLIWSCCQKEELVDWSDYLPWERTRRRRKRHK